MKLGLPVHRAGSGTRAPVLAFPYELDAWLAATPISARGKDRRRDASRTERLANLRREARSTDVRLTLSTHQDRMQKLLVSLQQLNATVQRAKREHRSQITRDSSSALAI
jgi:hypothetical protein